MGHNFKISVITPSFNSSRYLEDAIQSVINQKYPNFEHIIVDGGSTDNTLDIFRKYDHLIWVSEKDEGQSDAMNKGFRMATGEIIVYLNADDYFLPGAFQRVMPYFKDGAEFVVGTVIVENEYGETYINDPKATFDEMLRHWEKNAFPVNPVQYFYLRKVQAKTPGFNPDNHIAMDLEFLLECARICQFTKIEDPSPLGVFRLYENTKTGISNRKPEDLFSFASFSFIDRFLEGRTEDFIEEFNNCRKKGYKNRIKWLRISNEKRKNSIKYKMMVLQFKLIDFIKSERKISTIRAFLHRNL